jgi:hypothetical protein
LANVRFWLKSGHVQAPIITLIGSYAIGRGAAASPFREPHQSREMSP